TGVPDTFRIDDEVRAVEPGAEALAAGHRHAAPQVLARRHRVAQRGRHLGAAARPARGPAALGPAVHADKDVPLGPAHDRVLPRKGSPTPCRRCPGRFQILVRARGMTATTPQHHIIRETSDSLSRLLQDEFKRAGYKRVHIVDQAPKPDAIEGKLPAVSVYRYQVSLDTEGVDGNVHSELVTVQKPDGTIEEYRRRRRLWIRLDYLISTWAQTPEDEQLLLGLAIRAIMEHPSIGREKLRGGSFE